MEYCFRQFPPNDSPVPGPGELYVYPGPDQARARAAELARLALEDGPEGFLRGPGAVGRIVIKTDPTLDDMLAAAFLEGQLCGRPLPPGARALALYAAVAREGLKPGDLPLADSLAGVYLAVRHAAGEDLGRPEMAARFLADWSRMAELLLATAAKDANPFTTPLFATAPEFARARAYLAKDWDVYARQDVPAGERWLVRIPGGAGPAGGLLLRRPRSILWKYWSREDREAPGGRGYLFLAVLPEATHWRFSTDPAYRLSIRGLAEELQRAEQAKDPARAALDSWFAGKQFGHTLVGAPRTGTRLGDDAVLRIVKRWTRARVERPGRMHRGIWRKAAWAGVAACVLIALVLAKNFRPGPATTPGASEAPSHPVEPPPAAAKPAAGGRTLYMLAVGVSRYRGAGFQLDYARNDANALVEVFRKQARVFQRCCGPGALTDEGATRANIQNALGALALEARRASPDDLVVVALAGHGMRDDNNSFYFIPHDFDPGSPWDRVISWDDLKRPLGRLPCPVLVIMDTCHSGEIARADQLFQGAGQMVVMAACAGGRQARERQDWEHGALTKAILEVFAGAGPGNGDTISLMDLQYWASERLRFQDFRSNNTGNIDLGRVGVGTRNP